MFFGSNYEKTLEGIGDELETYPMQVMKSPRLCTISISWVALSLILSAAAVVSAADWPQFRGPGGLGIGQASSLPTDWTDTKNVVWKTELPGAGTSGPVIFKDRVFLTYQTGYAVDPNNLGNINDLKRHVLCVDAKTGKSLWKWDAKTVLPEIDTRRFRSYASSTPAVDDEGVYCFLGKSGVVALDHKGNLLWQTSVGEETHGWGSASSPILYQNLVIVNAFVECGQLVALDKKTGKEVWRAGELKESWNTPLLVALPNGKTELVVAISGKILAFDPATENRCGHATGTAGTSYRASWRTRGLSTASRGRVSRQRKPCGPAAAGTSPIRMSSGPPRKDPTFHLPSTTRGTSTSRTKSQVLRTV